MDCGKKRKICSTSANFRLKAWRRNIRNSSAGSKKRGGPYHTRLPPKILLREVLTGGLLTAGAAFVFYRSVWAMVLGIVLIPLYVRSRRERWRRMCTQNLQQQFISGMQMVAGSLAAGYSMENAWRRAEKELIVLYGPEAEFCVQMRYMNQRLAVSEPLERILLDFAAESDVEEIRDFSEVFSYAKRSGGNLTEIIRSVTERMQRRAEILTEIETAVASKKMEQRMMNFLLPGILLFVTVSSPSYVSTLYHNALGILVMSICLGGYLCCMYWSEQITDIAV
ncbi:MAG: type II secretion system F family protein [Lachnospiraceae bacterium]|nr:type II secretion system F family protein [Lachnospiraceae bacterium]